MLYVNYAYSHLLDGSQHIMEVHEARGGCGRGMYPLLCEAEDNYLSKKNVQNAKFIECMYLLETS